MEVRDLAFKIITSNLWRTKYIQFVNPPSDSDLEEGVDEKQHHEPEDGILYILQR
jgi:hypothetical protein